MRNLLFAAAMVVFLGCGGPDRQEAADDAASQQPAQSATDGGMDSSSGDAGADSSGADGSSGAGASDGRSSDRGSTDGGSSGDTVSAPDETLAAVQPDSDTSLTPTPDTPVIDDFPVAGPPRGGRTPRPSPDSSGDDAPTGTATGSEGSGSASGTDAGSSSDTSASGTSTETGETDSNTALVPRQPDPAPDAPSCEHTHGMFLPAAGQLNTLVLFIRYRDEDLDNAWWPADGFPDGWQEFIDARPDQQRTNFYNLTHFYREASRNAETPFVLVGRVDTVTADLSIQNELDYGNSNRTVLQQVENRYDAALGRTLDRWSRAENCHSPGADGDIDLVIMIWRSNRFSNSSLAWSGIAHIGGSRTPAYTFLGKNVKRPAFNSNFSSGVTVALRERAVRDGLLTPDAVFKSTVHEIAHQQITYWHPQAGSDGQQRFPSMLTYAEQQIHTHSGREAGLLGWGEVMEVRRDTVITLGDFYRTGKSVWVETSGHRYLIENRQKTSVYDDASVNADDKGLFVYQYRSERPVTLSYDNTNANIIPLVSDGFYDWEFSGRWLSGWRAIFNRGGANSVDGSGFTRKQPSTGGNHHWISAMVVDGQELRHDFRGTGLYAAYTIDRPRLGPETNPSVPDLELDVLGQQGEEIRLRVVVR
ncbi:MAG: hypothetical protein HLUCCA01_02295 [Bacteroidetes bacterium HLUCCA01]|nr:MAG: hypothetical protein HLUCCA01_02295 [Bacteroidetes bacterium HLUCCA01]